VNEPVYGKYQLLERLGHGGMAEVFLARMMGPLNVSRYVALKRMLPEVSRIAELNQMFMDEIRLVVHLSHPAIIPVIDFGVEDERVYLTMEFVEGQDLRTILKRGKRIPIECCLYIAAQVARALDYAHKLTDAQDRPLGIVHRDITPSNVMISYRGDVKLADFGIARAASQVRMSSTRTGEIKGTIRYMSPEQAGGMPIDHRSDLFALSTVLLEMVTGKSAFKCDSELQALKLVQSGRAPERDLYADLIPQDVAEILDQAMQLSPADRFADGDQFATALELALRKREPAFGPSRVAAFVTETFAAERAQLRARLRSHDTGGGDSDDLAGADTHPSLNAGDQTRREGAIQLDEETSAGKAQTRRVPVSLDEPPAGPKNRLRLGAAVLAIGLVGLGVGIARLQIAGTRSPQTTAQVAAPIAAPVATPPPAPVKTPTATAPTPAVVAQPEPAPSSSELPRPSLKATHARRVSRGFATLNLQTTPWAIVQVDGKSIGQTPIQNVRIPAGKHDVAFVNPGLPKHQIKIDLAADEVFTRSIDLTR
jgi:serine/threonine protein kinase